MSESRAQFYPFPNELVLPARTALREIMQGPPVLFKDVNPALARPLSALRYWTVKDMQARGLHARCAQLEGVRSARTSNGRLSNRIHRDPGVMAITVGSITSSEADHCFTVIVEPGQDIDYSEIDGLAPENLPADVLTVPVLEVPGYVHYDASALYPAASTIGPDILRYIFTV